jgi:superfamily II DNA or RNA helicase
MNDDDIMDMCIDQCDGLEYYGGDSVDASEEGFGDTSNTKSTDQTKLVKPAKQPSKDIFKNKINYDHTNPAGPEIALTKSGAFINFSQLADTTYIRKIENYFTIKTMLITGGFKQVKCCKVDKKKQRIIVPRFGIYELINNPKFGLSKYNVKSYIKDGLAPSISFKWVKDFFNNNQKIISEYIMKNIYTASRVANGSAGVILNLEAGQGKSYIAAYLMSQIKKKTVIILHSTSLLDQWVTVLNDALPGIKIGMYYHKKKIEGDVMLMIVKSALSNEFTFGEKKINCIDYYNQFGFIIFDECHEYANKFGSKIFDRAQTPYMLGLSATPDERTTGFDRISWWGIGPVMVAKNLPEYQETIKDFSADVYRISYSGPAEYTKLLRNEYTDMFNVAGTVNMICQDEHRNALVIDCIKKCLEQKRSTFVFADRREYLETLKNLLKANAINGEIVTSNEEYMRIVGGTKLQDLSKAEKAASVIFSTYQYIGTGKSIPRMTALVLATPRKTKMKQYVGRIFRLGYKPEMRRIIYDIVDMKIPLKNQWSSRKKHYDEHKYDITTKSVKYTDLTVLNSAIIGTSVNGGNKIDNTETTIDGNTDGYTETTIDGNTETTTEKIKDLNKSNMLAQLIFNKLKQDE